MLAPGPDRQSREGRSGAATLGPLCSVCVLRLLFSHPSEADGGGERAGGAAASSRGQQGGRTCSCAWPSRPLRPCRQFAVSVPSTGLKTGKAPLERSETCPGFRVCPSVFRTAGSASGQHCHMFCIHLRFGSAEVPGRRGRVTMKSRRRKKSGEHLGSVVLRTDALSALGAPCLFLQTDGSA